MIVAFGYQKGSGKDTAAEYLHDEWGFRTISFAGAIKEGCMDFFGLTANQVYGSEKEVVDSTWGVTPRHILQYVGTDLIRNQFDQEIWVKRAMKEIDRVGGDWDISDLRFPNEAEAVKARGGLVIRLDRPGLPFDPHPSERAMEDYDEWDYIIKNDGSLGHLYDLLDDIMAYHFKTGY
jgi:hypothetical protein